MQTIAIACLAVAAMNSAFLLWTLWRMSSTGHRPVWLGRLIS